MTDYPAKGSRTGWKKHQNSQRWQIIFAVFIFVILAFAVFNGLLKSFSIKKYLSSSKWDGKSSFVSVITTSPVAVLIYQKDPKRLAFLNLSGDLYLPTGEIDNPLIRLSDITENDRSELTKILSVAFGAKISNYVELKNNEKVTEEKAKNLFKNFASPLTVLKILSPKSSNSIEDTNLTRSDWFRLWWQVKELGIEKVKIADLEGFSEEIINEKNQKVLGVDTESLHKKISEYLEQKDLVESDIKVKISNQSHLPLAGELASDFVSSAGLKVVEVEYSESYSLKSQIVAKNKGDFVSSYLANLFDCDIVASQKDQDDGLIVINIGVDFANLYFK